MLSEAFSAPQSNFSRPIIAALALSLLAHITAVAVLRFPEKGPQPKRLVVSLTRLPAEREEKPPLPQIVSPSEQTNPALPPPETSHRSERDSRVAREQIKRGEGVRELPAPPPKPVATKSAEQPARESQTAPKAQQPRQLKLSEDKLLGQIAAAQQKETNDTLARAVQGDFAPKHSDTERLTTLESYEPFSHNSLKRLFSSKPGDADFLPNIPDGDITLLNAKADHFAVFVRRVALQVFGALRRKSWAALPLAEASRAREFTVLEAILSPNGKLIKVRLTDSSGSESFDRVVTSAAEEGAWDQNPPPAAIAADGNYHFIFQAKTWARFIPNAAQEQRWILLGTGLL